jgi:hypothetical protein
MEAILARWNLLIKFKRQKKRRYEPFKPNHSAELVRSYLSCIDELANLEMVLSGTLLLLTQLKDKSDKRKPKRD